jgi:hypothetical protein
MGLLSMKVIKESRYVRGYNGVSHLHTGKVQNNYLNPNNSGAVYQIFHFYYRNFVLF